jgi:hypothetical protein
MSRTAWERKEPAVGGPFATVPFIHCWLSPRAAMWACTKNPGRKARCAWEMDRGSVFASCLGPRGPFFEGFPRRIAPRCVGRFAPDTARRDTPLKTLKRRPAGAQTRGEDRPTVHFPMAGTGFFEYGHVKCRGGTRASTNVELQPIGLCRECLSSLQVQRRVFACFCVGAGFRYERPPLRRLYDAFTTPLRRLH